MERNHNSPILLTIAEAAKLLNLSARTLHDLKNRGRIRFVQLAPGHAVRIPRDAIDEFIADNSRRNGEQ